MLYVLHRDLVVGAACDFRPARPSGWARGQIVSFATTPEALPLEVKYAILGSLPGLAWHVEILHGTTPLLRGAGDSFLTTVRILRPLIMDAETLALIAIHAAGTNVRLPVHEAAGGLQQGAA